MTNQYIAARAQQGSVLIVALMLLLVLTMLGITALNNMTLEERMAAGYQKMELAFQGAETTLAQNITNTTLFEAATKSTCVDCVCDPTDDDNADIDLDNRNGAGVKIEATYNATWQGTTDAAVVMPPGYELGGELVAYVFTINAEATTRAGSTVAAKSAHEQTIAVPFQGKACEFTAAGTSL